ncbi:calcium-binding protein [Cochlodiniinecator piscidefendens]|uniref:calcium-binding protein n=1 Tax=Cochlodiniinecator piscidefendens TaxID=2715756 RepID=UPI00140E4E80|nr:hypothetical protein [Cochlodiniinecator piscidefendens]
MQYQVTPLYAGGENNLTIAGRFFELMKDNLIGKKQLDVSGSNSKIDVHTFAGDGAVVVFLSSLTLEKLNYVYNLGGMAGNVEIAQLGVVTGSTNGEFGSETGFQPYNEPDALLEVSNLGPVNNGTTFTLDSYEHLMVTIDTDFAGTNSADTLLGSIFDDTIADGGGNDTIHGGGGHDVLDAGLSSNGLQVLNGQSGNDTYQYATDHGLVYIGHHTESLHSGTMDRVVFADLNVDDFTFATADYSQISNLGNQVAL